MEDSKREQQERAAARIEHYEGMREENKAKLARKGGMAAANDPGRLRKRVERLADYYGAETMKRAVTQARDAEADFGAEDGLESVRETEGVVLERIIGRSDLLDVRYFEEGFIAQRAVGRVRIFSPDGDELGSGTGFMVSPRLLLTNNHVLESPEIAAASRIEFNFQEGLDGNMLPSVSFPLDPGTFWITDVDLDFSLVAVDAAAAQLRPFGFLRLIGAQGKVVVGECVTIIQHPGGDPKQVALRDNRVVAIPDDDVVIHYETDTERGSSGSSSLNDQWEVVALHHASIRRGDAFVNEGIRVSSLLDFIRANAPGGSRAEELRAELLGLESAPRREAVPPAAPPDEPRGDDGAPSPARRRGPGPDAGGGAAAAAAGGGRVVTVTVPLEITIRVGGEGDAPVVVSAGGAGAGERGDGLLEAISIDPDYSSRTGYDAAFLGTGALAVPLPTLTQRMLANAAMNRAAGSGPRHVLPYHHFSVVMNRRRKLAYLTAVNIDGQISHRISRDPDRWIRDPRIGADEQAGEDVYRANDLDRGHLVRRLDPAWGSSRDVAKRANDDTFHFTNCSPQHKRFNQGDALWAGLEDYVLDNTDNHDLKVSVFTGPVLDDAADIPYRGIQLPLQFWKVVATVRGEGRGRRLSATGYLLSQEELLRGMDREAVRVRPESFEFGAYRTFQVPVEQIERLTGLDFGRLPDFDPLAGREAAVSRRALESFEDIRL